MYATTHLLPSGKSLIFSDSEVRMAEATHDAKLNGISLSVVPYDNSYEPSDKASSNTLETLNG